MTNSWLVGKWYGCHSVCPGDKEDKSPAAADWHAFSGVDFPLNRPLSGVGQRAMEKLRV